MTIGIDC